MCHIFRISTLTISAWLLSAIAAMPASATIISGSFTGIAVNVQGNPFTVQDGDTVYGSFFIDLAYPYEYRSGDRVNSVQFEYNGMPVSPDPLPPPPVIIDLQAEGQDYSYYLQGSVADIGLARDAGGQVLSVETGYGGHCCAAWLTLAGKEGALFSALDLAAIHPGDIDFSRSKAAYASKGTLYFEVGFTSFAFDAAPVPEPASLPLAMTGLVALLLATRRRRI